MGQKTSVSNTPGLSKLLFASSATPDTYTDQSGGVARSGAAHFGATAPSAFPPVTGAANPTAPAAPARPPGDYDLSQPGMGEDTVSQHIGDMFKPTNSQGAYAQGTFNTPTASENFYNQNGAAMAAPGAASSYYNQHSGDYNTPGAAETFFNQHQGDQSPDVTNRAEEAYQGLKGKMPDIAADPGLEPYYKDAEARGLRSLSTQMAALGSYGSSVALGQGSNLVSGLEGEMASRKAQYNLDRLAEQRQWEGLLGNEAGMADSSSSNQQKAKLSWLLGLGGLAQGAQSGQLGRLTAGAGAASNADTAALAHLTAASGAANSASNADLQRQGLGIEAAGQADSQNRGSFEAGTSAALQGQGARNTRITGAFNNQMGLAQAIAGIAGQSQQGAISSDEAFQNATQSYKLQDVQNAVAIANANAQRDTAMWLSIFQGILGAGGGIAGGAIAAGAKK